MPQQASLYKIVRDNQYCGAGNARVKHARIILCSDDFSE